MIIPRPSTLNPLDGTLVLHPEQTLVRIEGNPPNHVREMLHHALDELGLESSESGSIEEKPAPVTVHALLDTDTLPDHPEGYRMQITPEGIQIASGTGTGLRYAATSLLQWIATAPREKGAFHVPAVSIEDTPRFSWRGMHLDVSRHFFPKEAILRYLDLLAFHKLNIFHWHLTDDQGWRIAIEAYPKLAEVAAWRRDPDGTRYGGMYSREEIRDVVAYADRLGITVVPEIEMPGHARAALAAYPELSCTGETQEVPNDWGIFDDVFCAGNDDTFRFLEAVLNEVCELFPGPYIHIGGDEVPSTNWEACPKCRLRMKREKLEGAAELQGWFTSRIAWFLAERGKHAVGWDEVLAGNPPRDTMIMSWRGMEEGIRAAEEGHKVIMSPVSHCYFDYPQVPEGEPREIEDDVTLERVYAFDPVPEELDNGDAARIQGGQGNVWTERMGTWERVETMVLPRLCALSEVLWSRERASFEDFRSRLRPHLANLDRLGYHFFPLE